MSTEPPLLRAVFGSALWRRGSKPHDAALSLPAFSILDRVQAEGPLSLGRLAELEGIKPPSVSRQVDALLSAGLIRTDRSGDRRVSMVAITGAGAAELAAERRRYDAWLADRLAFLGTEDVAILREAIELFDRLVRSC